MGDTEQKAQALIAEAQKKLTSSKGFFGSLFGFVNNKNFHIIVNMTHIYIFFHIHKRN